MSTLDSIPSQADFNPSRWDRNPIWGCSVNRSSNTVGQSDPFTLLLRHFFCVVKRGHRGPLHPGHGIGGVGGGGYGSSFTTAVTSNNCELCLLVRVICCLTSAAAVRPNSISHPQAVTCEALLCLPQGGAGSPGPPAAGRLSNLH